MENNDSFDGVHIEGSENSDFTGNFQHDDDDVERYEQSGQYSPTPGGSRDLSPRSSWSRGRDSVYFGGGYYGGGHLGGDHNNFVNFPPPAYSYPYYPGAPPLDPRGFYPPPFFPPYGYPMPHPQHHFAEAPPGPAQEVFEVLDEWDRPPPPVVPTGPLCVVPREVCANLSDLFTLGITTERSVAISEEFPVSFELEGTAFRPPKRDDWLDRRAKEKNVSKQLNKFDDTMSKIQFKFGDIMPPLLTAQAHVEPGSRAALAVEAAVEQCGRAFVHVTRQRRLNASNLTDPNKEYLLKRNDVFATGPEARDWLFTGRFWTVPV